MEPILAVVFISAAVESIAELYKEIISSSTRIFRILSIVLGVIAAFTFSVDLFSLVGIESELPFVAVILSGLILGRGSNFVHDFLNRV